MKRMPPCPSQSVASSPILCSSIHQSNCLVILAQCSLVWSYRGVVQLFNAVKKQQKDIDEKLNEVGSSVRKRDKVLKSVTKGAFLDMLKGPTSADKELVSVNKHIKSVGGGGVGHFKNAAARPEKKLGASFQTNSLEAFQTFLCCHFSNRVND